MTSFQTNPFHRAVALTTLASAIFWLPADALAAGLVGARTRSHATGDFNGDGRVDRALGLPQVDFGQGSVVVVYGDGHAEEWSRSSPDVLYSPTPGDYFGDSVATGDINGDGFDDLVIGVPGDGVGSVANAGSVHILYGSPDGITAAFDQVFSQSSIGIDGIAKANDNFGEFVAVADFDCDGYADVWS